MDVCSQVSPRSDGQGARAGLDSSLSLQIWFRCTLCRVTELIAQVTWPCCLGVTARSMEPERIDLGRRTELEIGDTSASGFCPPDLQSTGNCTSL